MGKSNNYACLYVPLVFLLRSFAFVEISAFRLAIAEIKSNIDKRQRVDFLEKIQKISVPSKSGSFSASNSTAAKASSASSMLSTYAI